MYSLLLLCCIPVTAACASVLAAVSLLLRLLLFRVVRIRDAPEPLRRLLRRQVSLGLRKELVADHKLLDGGRAEQRRQEHPVEGPVVARLGQVLSSGCSCDT